MKAVSGVVFGRPFFLLESSDGVRGGNADEQDCNDTIPLLGAWNCRAMRFWPELRLWLLCSGATRRRGSILLLYKLGWVENGGLAP
jgi:hypothetical protein